MAQAANRFIFSTGEPAYAVNRDGTVLAWNQAAARVFGYPAARALGSHCWELLRGLDVFGNRYCGRHCPQRDMVCRHESVNRCRLQLRSGTGGYQSFVISTVALFDGPGRETLIHLCRPCAITSSTCCTNSTPTAGSRRSRLRGGWAWCEILCAG